MSLASTNSGMKGTAFYPQGHSPRTRDHSAQSDSEKDMRTPTQKLSDLYLAAHERRQAEDRAEEQRKIEEQRRLQEAEHKKQEAARRQQELQHRRAAFELAEDLTEQMFAAASLTPSERSVVNNRLMDADKIHDLERTKFEVSRIVAERI